MAARAPGVDHRKPVRLAQAALQQAVAGKWKAVEHTMQRLGTECHGEDLTLALVALCDTFAEHAEGCIPEFGKVRAVAWNTDTGEVGRPARESVQWATNLIQARASGDIEAFKALLGALNAMEDGFQRGRYVLELLESVALTIRSLPRGYARMGREGGPNVE